MYVHNIRRGFATNSSSTHSMVFIPKGERTKRDKQLEQGCFGWQEFAAVSPNARALWLSAHLVQNASPTCGRDVARALAHSWLGVDPSALVDVYVDHQSAIDLPKGWDGLGVNKQFFDELKEFVLQDGMVVLGGNDNQDTQEGPIDYRAVLSVDGRQDHKTVARKDSRGWWAIFDRRDGTKYHVSFGDKDLSKVDPDKSDVPELVDVKITDFCPYECSFCYQASTKKGRHADMSDIQQIAFVLSEMQTFEVALGGGETTLHPKFLEILETFQRYGVVPNFTTRNLAWLRDPAYAQRVMNTVGAWAFSTEDADQVKKLGALLTTLEWPRDKSPNVQYIVGVGSAYQFENVLKETLNAGLKVTLLGPKTTGRGKDHSWDKFEWFKIIREMNKKGLDIGIDTALAQKFSEELKKAKVPEWCYQKEEGKFSMYIDAVEKTVSPSSYCKPEDKVPYIHVGNAIQENFSKW